MFGGGGGWEGVENLNHGVGPQLSFLVVSLRAVWGEGWEEGHCWSEFIVLLETPD
jgi:hypothetical protein